MKERYSGQEEQSRSTDFFHAPSSFDLLIALLFMLVFFAGERLIVRNIDGITFDAYTEFFLATLALNIACFGLFDVGGFLLEKQEVSPGREDGGDIG